MVLGQRRPGRRQPRRPRADGRARGVDRGQVQVLLVRRVLLGLAVGGPVDVLLAGRRDEARADAHLAGRKRRRQARALDLHPRAERFRQDDPVEHPRWQAERRAEAPGHHHGPGLGRRPADRSARRAVADRLRDAEGRDVRHGHAAGGAALLGRAPAHGAAEGAFRVGERALGFLGVAAVRRHLHWQRRHQRPVGRAAEADGHRRGAHHAARHRVLGRADQRFRFLRGVPGGPGVERSGLSRLHRDLHVAPAEQRDLHPCGPRDLPLSGPLLVRRLAGADGPALLPGRVPVPGRLQSRRFRNLHGADGDRGAARRGGADVGRSAPAGRRVIGRARAVGVVLARRHVHLGGHAPVDVARAERAWQGVDGVVQDAPRARAVEPRAGVEAEELPEAALAAHPPGAPRRRARPDDDDGPLLPRRGVGLLLRSDLQGRRGDNLGAGAAAKRIRLDLDGLEPRGGARPEEAQARVALQRDRPGGARRDVQRVPAGHPDLPAGAARVSPRAQQRHVHRVAVLLVQDVR
mmetsp:Transcript_68180/g.209043  ORF Transcript_68180/g.209043 Transcript_68180/m.209043 type:complete len:521 (+) Transcript_68180:195-1757(+)